MLSLRQVEDVCLFNQDTYKRCRYLACDETTGDYHCLKLSSKAKEIDFEVDDFLNELNRKNKSFKNEKLPVGNNCKGYIILKNKLQGYDVK